MSSRELNTMAQVGQSGSPAVKSRGQLKLIWFRFKKNKMALLGLAIVLALALVAVFAGVIADYDTLAVKQNMSIRMTPPCKEHIFGTDHYGRDMFARIVHGARISLTMGFITLGISLTVGSLLGSIAGFYGGKIDNVIMRICDVFLAIPSTLFALTIVAALGGGLVNLLIAMSISRIPNTARVVRSSILNVQGSDYIEAARACGTPDRRIIMKHIIPNAIGPIIVSATLGLGNTIVAIAGMSFIGLGVEAPTPEWGAMLSEGKQFLRSDPYLCMIPGIAIVLAVLGFNLVGDGLRDALDPKLKN